MSAGAADDVPVQGRFPPGCPLTECELEAYRLRADGLTPTETAVELGCSPDAVKSRLRDGRGRLGLPTIDAALQALIDGGWLDRQGHDPRPALRSYLAVKECYDAAPVLHRDDMLVADLKAFCAEDAKHPPCSWVAGLVEHEGPVTFTDNGRALCAAHHAELEAARERRSTR